MSRYGYGGDWAPYVPVAEQRRRAELEIKKLRGKGKSVAPVTIEGRRIATTFWGKAWCENIESYRDYEYRLERGRSYVRNGLVLDLQIARGAVTALVSGSQIYRIGVDIAEIAATAWQAICADCSSGIDSLVDLLRGAFSKGVMERLCRQDSGLFPKPKDIRFSCTCPDGASMCKHVAAVLYGVGARLDQAPDLLFELRGVDPGDLIAQAGASTLLSTVAVAADKILAADDLSALFGLDIDAPPATPQKKPLRQRKAKQPPPKRVKPAAKARRGDVANRAGKSPAVLSVDVSISSTAPRRLEVVVADGAKPGHNATIQLAFTRKTLDQSLIQARDFVERAIDDLFDAQWTHWFRSSYGWQFSTAGFDMEEGLHLRLSIPLDQKDE